MKFLQRMKFNTVNSSHKIVFVFDVLFALLLLQFGIFYHQFEKLTEANKRTEDGYRIILISLDQRQQIDALLWALRQAVVGASKSNI
jgi:hypothetical protein